MATIKYDRNHTDVLFQYLYKNVVAVSLPNSRALAINTADMNAPEKSIPIPIIEKHAAITATNNAEIPRIIGKTLSFDIIGDF
jgi:hypothetical protein